MDDLSVFKRILECRKQLENIGTIWGNLNEKKRERVEELVTLAYSLATLNTEAGLGWTEWCSAQRTNYCLSGALSGAVRQPLTQKCDETLDFFLFSPLSKP